MHRAPLFFTLVSNNHSFSPDNGTICWDRQEQTQVSMLQQRTNKTLTTGPFSHTYEADEVSPEVEVGVVVGLKCLQT
jgi:hypothetical protein